MLERHTEQLLVGGGVARRICSAHVHHCLQAVKPQHHQPQPKPALEHARPVARHGLPPFFDMLLRCLPAHAC